MLVRLLATAGVLALSAGAASAEYTLTILHINDFHARFEPINGSDSTCGEKDAAENKCFGGIARLVTAVTDARSRTANSLLIDAGDQFQGSLFYNHYKGKVSAEFMNALGFEAMAVGNHEFDDGPPELAHFLEQIRFPMVMANADLSREPLLKGRIAKSVVVEKAGEKIGIIGLTPLDNPELASPGPNIIFTPPADAVQAEVDTLTAAGVNKIIVLSHSGYEVDKQIAAETEGLVDTLKSQRDGIFWVQEMMPPEKVREVYSLADVFVCPSIYEPLGIVNLEAMACGTPVVATAVSGLPEVVHDGVTGILLPPGDPASLAVALRGIARGEVDTVSLSRGARALIEEQFDSRAQAAVLAAWQSGPVPAPSMYLADQEGAA